MQNKFTQKAQNTLRCAMTEAGNLGHAYIGSEHLLLALAAEKDSIAARILFARGLGVAVIKAAIVGIDGDGERGDGGDIVEFFDGRDVSKGEIGF